MQTSNVLLVHDQCVLAEAACGLLVQFCNLDRLERCASVPAAVAQIAADPPDLVILNLNHTCVGWRDIADALACHHPTGRLILLTRLLPALGDTPESVLAVIDKAAGLEALISVVAQWQRQRQGCPIKVISLFDQVQHLTPREQRVFEALGRGLLNRDIALAAGLSLATVATYRKSISAKLGLSGSELVRAAVLYRCLPTQALHQGGQPQPPMPQPCIPAPMRGIPR